MAGFCGIIMDSENHGSWSHRDRCSGGLGTEESRGPDGPRGSTPHGSQFPPLKSDRLQSMGPRTMVFRIKSMVIPQNPAKIQKSIIFIVFLMFFLEILANSRSRDREESIPIDLAEFHPILTNFISIYMFFKKKCQFFLVFPR